MSRLEQKLKENRERREREEILCQLTGPLKSVLSKADFFPGEEISSGYLLSDERERAKLTETESGRIDFSDFDSEENTCSYLRELSLTLQPPVQCRLKDGPLFRINEPFEISMLEELFSLSHFWVNIVEEDNHRGVICREYIGYLEPERITNNRELVYEVFCFYPPISCNRI